MLRGTSAILAPKQDGLSSTGCQDSTELIKAIELFLNHDGAAAIGNLQCLALYGQVAAS